MLTRCNRALRVLLTGSKPSVDRQPLGADPGALLAEQLETFGAGVRRQPLDGEYWTAPRADIEAVLARDPTDLLVWTPDAHDCEDYAWALRHVFVSVFGVTSVGFVNDHGAGHAYTVAIDSTERVWVIEPDGDGIWPASAFPDVDDRHQLRRATILL